MGGDHSELPEGLTRPGLGRALPSGASGGGQRAGTGPGQHRSPPTAPPRAADATRRPGAERSARDPTAPRSPALSQCLFLGSTCRLARRPSLLAPQLSGPHDRFSGTSLTWCADFSSAWQIPRCGAGEAGINLDNCTLVQARDTCF